MLKAVFFDLDGTLLPMDEKVFGKGYIPLLFKKAALLGYQDSKEFIDIVTKGIIAIYQNDGKQTNKTLFWDIFCDFYGGESRNHISVFEDFYGDEFKQTKQYTQPNPYAREIIDYCHNHVQYSVLSTNPVFPDKAQLTRLSFVGLKKYDFDFITDYANSRFCKPDPRFFSSLLEQFHLTADEVIVFGNNTLEDGVCASSLGIKVYLVNGYILQNEGVNDCYEHVDMKDVTKVIEKEIELRK